MAAKRDEKKQVRRKTKNKYVTREKPTAPHPVKNTNAKKANSNRNNKTEFEVLAEIPIPWTRITQKELIFPFELMEVGNSFQFAKEKVKGQNVYSASVGYCRQPENFHKKFIVRKIKEEIINRVDWVIWGCWREEDLSQEEIDEKKKIIMEKQAEANKNRKARYQRS